MNDTTTINRQPIGVAVSPNASARDIAEAIEDRARRARAVLIALLAEDQHDAIAPEVRAASLAAADALLEDIPALHSALNARLPVESAASEQGRAPAALYNEETCALAGDLSLALWDVRTLARSLRNAADPDGPVMEDAEAVSDVMHLSILLRNAAQNAIDMLTEARHTSDADRETFNGFRRTLCQIHGMAAVMDQAGEPVPQALGIFREVGEAAADLTVRLMAEVDRIALPDPRAAA